MVFTFGMMMAGTAGADAVGLARDRGDRLGWRCPAIVWVTLVYVAVAASAMTFVLLQYASLRLPAAKVMAYTYLVPAG